MLPGTEDGGDEAAQRAFGYEESRPPPATTDRRYADWWTRAGAFLLDIGVLVGVGMVAAIVAILLTDRSEETTRLIAYAVGIPLGLVYAPLLMARRGHRNGQTLGKQALGIRVVRVDGRPVTIWDGVVRQLFAQQLLLGLTFYLYAPFDYLWPLRDARRQCLHDKIASTWVVRADAQASQPPADADRPQPPADITPWTRPHQPEQSLPGGWLPPRADR